MQNMDGPKAWDFCTARELEKYILGNNVYELLARSGLVANEMICKYGSRMQLQIKRRDLGAAIVRYATGFYYFWSPFQWRCSESCTNGYGETFHVLPTCMSWFWNLDRDRDVATVLKRVISLVREGPNSSGTTKLDDDAPRYWKKLLEQYDELLKYVRFVRIRLFPVYILMFSSKFISPLKKLLRVSRTLSKIPFLPLNF